MLILVLVSIVSLATANVTAAPSNEFTAADEEIGADHGPTPIHILDRGIFSSIASSATQNVPTSLGDSMPQAQARQAPTNTTTGNSVIYDEFELNIGKNCSFTSGDVFCDCDLFNRRFSCFNVQSSSDVTSAFQHLLATTRQVYWSTLEVHCVEPFVNDEPASSGPLIEENVDGKIKSDSGSNTKSFHISLELFADGPKFESVVFVGDCSKPKHYDNLALVDEEVMSIKMQQNILRMATSCLLLQPKFGRLNEITIRDSLVAGDMISSTFSSRCLGQYGTRNEPLPLTRLTISNCNISLIESGAFFNFGDLELIDLSHNRISHLSRKAFAPVLYKLRTINLNDNRLQSLPSEFFEKLPSLREINLAKNRLQTLPMIPMNGGGPGQAQVLHIGRNPWDCRCRLTWLLDEPMDSVRLIVDEPKCAQPVPVKGQALFKGLQTVRETYC